MQRVYNVYVQNLVNSKVNKNRKSLWSFIKSKRKDPVDFQSYKEVPWSVILILKQTFLNDYFCSVFTKEDDGPLPENPYQKIVLEMEPITVTEDGVINLLDKL